MLRRTAKVTLRLGVLVLIAFVVKKLLDSQRGAPAPKPYVVEREPEPVAVVPAPEPEPEPPPASWVKPVGTVCPTSHPIKAKLGSKVFRRPDMPGYEASKPDRCYASEGEARRAGFTEARR